MAEIGFVGKAPGRYQVWLGADATGTRLNRVWKEMMKETDIETEFRPVFTRFAKERHAGERFVRLVRPGVFERANELTTRNKATKILCSFVTLVVQKMTPDQISNANAELRTKSPLEIIRWAIAQANGRAIVSTNFRLTRR